MSEYLSKTSSFAPYMVFPRFLPDMGINETAQIVYILLLDRARLSLKSDRWADDNGHFFIHYPVRSLAEALHKSEMTVKSSLAALEQAGLIERTKQGGGMPSRIYVKLPQVTDRKASVRGTENCLLEGQNPVLWRDRKLSPNNNNIYKTINNRDYTCMEGESL